MSVQISRRIFEQLEAATERPGVGKSMVIEDALDRFLSPGPPIEAVLRDQFEQLHARLDRFDRNIQIIAETVALHARYHLTVMPPLPEAEQREASLRGDDRFKVLAEQVDRRVRLGRPLMQETIGRLGTHGANRPEPAVDKTSRRIDPERENETNSESVADIQDVLIAAAGEGGSNFYFRSEPNSIRSTIN